MIICPFKDLKRYLPLINGLEEAMEQALAVTDFSGSSTPLSNGHRMNVMEIDTISVHGRPGEAHRKYMDIQYIVEGEEVMGWAPLEQLELVGEFDGLSPRLLADCILRESGLRESRGDDRTVMVLKVEQRR